MLTVHGFRYYDDYHQPQFTKIFKNMDAFTKWVMDTAKSKKSHERLRDVPLDTGGLGYPFKPLISHFLPLACTYMFPALL